MNCYKLLHGEETRTSECLRIRSKHPDRIPIIVCKADSCELDEIDKQKFLVPKDMSLGQFVYIIRKRIQLDKNQALFILINNKLVPADKILQTIYEKNKDPDGFLYIVYTTENTFG